MADVPIKIYTSVVRSQKFSPNNPPTTETPNPVINPDGAVVTFLTLPDVNSPEGYLGKNGFVPVVNDEKELVLQPLPNGQADGLISGGIVQWTGTGYQFNVSSALARFQGVFPLQSDFAVRTLTAADATNPRIDLFILQILFDGNGIPNGMESAFITGTPAATPAKPQVNPQTQIELTQVLVPALSTTPTLTDEMVYDENVEWTGTSSGTGTANFASAVNPKVGTVSVETTNIQNGFYIQFNNGSEIDISDYQTFAFWLALKSNMSGGQNITLQFLDGSLNPVSRTTFLDFDKSITAYQFIGVALSSIPFTSNMVQYVRFYFVRTGGSPTFAGYYLDVAKLEGGINPPNTIGIGEAPEDGQIYGRQNKSWVPVPSGGGGITGSGTANELAYFTGPTAIASLPVATYPSLAEIAHVKGVTSAIQTQINAKIGEAPNDGLAYTRKSLGWVQSSPFDLKQEAATDGQVLTWVAANSRYEPVTPSGGGGGNFIAYDVAQALTGVQRSQALDNIGVSAGSVQSFFNSGVVTINNLVITKSNIQFTGNSTVTLTGIVPLWIGQEVTIYNETNNNLTLPLNNAGSIYANRFQNALVIPNRTFAKIKYTALGGLNSWLITSTPFFIATTGEGVYQLGSVGIGQLHEAGVGLTVRTVGTVALRVNDLTGASRIFEVQNSLIRSNIAHSFGNMNPVGGVAVSVRPISFNIGIRFHDTSNVGQLDIMGNGNYQSKGGAFFGSANTSNVPTGRVDIRGVGLTTGNTLLLEDSAGTDNVIFVDNGQIRFLRIPTSSAGLAAGSVWRNGTNLEIV